MVPGFVETESDGTYKIHVDADGRIADNFFVEDVPEPDPLADSVGMPLDVLLRVGEERKENYRISDIWNYDAQLVSILAKPLVNPTDADIADLETGKRVIVKGRFASFEETGMERFLSTLGYPEGSSFSGSQEWAITDQERAVKTEVIFPNGERESVTLKNPPYNFDDIKTYAHITTNDGRAISVEMPTGKTVFSEGVLENLINDHPSIGDEIRIGAFVTRAKSEDNPESGNARLAANRCDPCYLDNPSEERNTKYNTLREQVGAEIEQTKEMLSKREYQNVRQKVGMLRSQAITVSELERVMSLVKTMPEEERSVYTEKRSRRNSPTNGWVKDIDNAYNTLLESMTKSEFVTFAHDAVTGERKQTGDHADISYLFMISEWFDIDESTREKLMTDCINARMSGLFGREYDNGNDFDDHYTTRQAFGYIAEIETETAGQVVVDAVCDLVDDQYFNKSGWKDRGENSQGMMLYHATSSLMRIAEKMPQVIEGNRQRLEEVRTTLAALSDEDSAIEYLDKALRQDTNLE